MNIFKLQYDWYEGEHDDVLLGKDGDVDYSVDDGTAEEKISVIKSGRKVKRNELRSERLIVSEEVTFFNFFNPIKS